MVVYVILFGGMHPVYYIGDACYNKQTPVC